MERFNAKIFISDLIYINIRIFIRIFAKEIEFIKSIYFYARNNLDNILNTNFFKKISCHAFL